MHTSTSPDLAISVEIMCKYVAGLITLKTMMNMVTDELDRGAWAMYLDAMEVSFRFQTDVTSKHMETMKDYQSWHQYVIVDQHEDV